MDKLAGTTKDIIAENISELKQLFPLAFSENKVDFDILKQILGDYIENDNERYSFNWHGKNKARKLATTQSTGTLRPCKDESVNWDKSENLFIEGDNLEVLKLLQKSYHKKVKMIYIDPPYNTGKDFVYKDNFHDNIKNYKEITGQTDGYGRNLSSNPETSGRYHTDWLNMMYPRLLLARSLLRDDGVIFISIDDNEVANLRKICDEIFGEENFVSTFMWKRKKEISNDSKNVSIQGEYIIIYTKTNIAHLKNEPLSEEYIKTSYKNPNSDFPLGKWRAVPITVSKGLLGGGYEYSITTPRGNIHNRIWAYPEHSFENLKRQGLIYWGLDKSGIPQRIMYAHESSGKPTTNYWDRTSSNKEGKNMIISLFGDNYFDTVKPLKLIKRLSQLIIDDSDLILDFFSGSATTAHAVMQLNAEDNGKRKYIMVQLPEACDETSEAYKAGYKNIAEIGKERIRLAANKIQTENPDYQGDLGFKVFKLDSTNIKPWDVDFDINEQDLFDRIDNIKPERSTEDILYEILLKYGLDLALPIEEHNILGTKLFNIGSGALIICLEKNISLELVEEIVKLKAEYQPETMRVVFQDSCFANDVIKTNAVQILQQAGITDVKSL